VTLSAGTKLGVYEILSPIGRGGMGEVYRARDTALLREVAIKVLPAEVAADPDRLSRFTREAQVLAALNHPNIAAIHGLEQGGGRPSLVMELVAGPDWQRSSAARGQRAGKRRPRRRVPSRGRSRPIARSTSPARLPTRSSTRTPRASSTAISSRPTSGDVVGAGRPGHRPPAGDSERVVEILPGDEVRR
jgi:serine/threonine protein kinase